MNPFDADYGFFTAEQLAWLMDEESVRVRVAPNGAYLGLVPQTDGSFSKDLRHNIFSGIYWYDKEGSELITSVADPSKIEFDATTGIIKIGDVTVKPIDSVSGRSSLDSQKESAADKAAAGAYKDGVYEATGKGIGGKVPLTVTIEGGKIVSVEVGDNGETQGIGSKAIEKLPDLIVAANGIEGVEGVSGASVTSKAIFTAMADILEQAKA